MPLLDPLSSVVAALQKEQLIPDVLPETFFPSLLFSIIWPNGKEALLGNELTREDTLDEPDINFTPMVVPDETTGELTSGNPAGEVTYTLVMLDPDAPSRADPKYKEFRHWVITGLKSPAAGVSETANMTALKMNESTTPYRPPGPPPGSGLHRYTFLLFQESPSAPLSIPAGAPEYGAALEERRSWSGIAFSEKYGLKLVGANFFLVRSTE